mgnify:CR=1 FL=1
MLLTLLIAAAIFGYLAWEDTRHATVQIDWATASEIDTVGFNLYRSNDPDRGFVRVNDEIIPASQEPLTGGVYSYTDTNVTPGDVYYYILEDVDMNGQLNRNSSPIEIRAKADFWLNLSLFILLIGLATLLVIHARWLNKSFESRREITIKGQKS